MRRTQKILGMLLCMMMLLAGFVTVTTDVDAQTTIYVDDDGFDEWNNPCYTSIQAAINAASDGDTVYVYSGTYNEDLYIRKTLTLMGEDKDNTVIVGIPDLSPNYVICVVGANDVSISGFTIIATDISIGIRLENSGNCALNNNIVTISSISLPAISVHKSSGSTVSDNIVSGGPFGIYVYESDNTVVDSNTISNSFYGITLYDSPDNEVSGNTISSSCTYGIRLKYSANSGVSSNTVSSSHGVFLDYSENTQIIDNTISTIGYSIDIYKSGGTTVTDNTLMSTKSIGIRIYGSPFVTTGYTVSGNDISSTNMGIHLFNCGSSTVSDNTLLSSNYGIYMELSASSTVSGNTLSCGYGGIYLYSSDDSTVSDNTLTATYHVFYIHATDRAKVKNNTISGSQDPYSGIFVSVADNNEFWENTISNNYRGISIWSSYGNLIYHNNIINNTIQAADSNPSLNDWHHPVLLEGNYWSDYTGVDDGSGVYAWDTTGKHLIAGDGIGDTLVPHHTTDYDYYPFTGANGWKLCDIHWNPPIHNTRKAGANVPIKFTAYFCDGRFYEDYGVVVEVVDSNGNVIESWTYTGNPTTGVKIDTVNEEYLVNWDTDPSMAGNTYTIIVYFSTGDTLTRTISLT